MPFEYQLFPVFNDEKERHDYESRWFDWVCEQKKAQKPLEIESQQKWFDFCKKAIESR